MPRSSASRRFSLLGREHPDAEGSRSGFPDQPRQASAFGKMLISGIGAFPVAAAHAVERQLRVEHRRWRNAQKQTRRGTVRVPAVVGAVATTYASLARCDGSRQAGVRAEA
jgi:hypothetical protein